MQHPPSYGTILVVVVSALSLVAGLVVVMVTSPDSIKLGSQLQIAGQTTATLTASPVPATATVPPPTAAATSAPNATPTALVTSEPSATPGPTETPGPTPTATGPAIPTQAPDAVAVGLVVTDNDSTARLRNKPSLDSTVIDAIPAGEYVQVLGASVKADDIDWLPVRHNKVSGWVAKGLIQSPVKP